MTTVPGAAEAWSLRATSSVAPRTTGSGEFALTETRPVRVDTYPRSGPPTPPCRIPTQVFAGFGNHVEGGAHRSPGVVFMRAADTRSK